MIVCKIIAIILATSSLIGCGLSTELDKLDVSIVELKKSVDELKKTADMKAHRDCLEVATEEQCKSIGR